MQTPEPKRPQYTGFLSGYLEKVSQAEELLAHYERLRELKRPPKRVTLDAIISGVVSLSNAAAERVPYLRDRGQLLFAHPDTTYFQHRPHIDAAQAAGITWVPLANSQHEEAEVPA